jgi:hypothetical protein
MGYLVKASFNAEPRAYSLEDIKTDVAAESLSATALVRHEKQDFWYSVGELIGESPVTEFQFTCPSCKETTSAREIDVGLDIPCQKCGAMDQAPDIRPPTDPAPDQHLLRRGKFLLTWGAALAIGTEILAVSGHAIIGGLIIETVGICMMINGYGKRKLFYLRHPSAADPNGTSPIC